MMTLEAVAQRLNREALHATVEYPGFIAIPIEDGRTWCFGTANENWGGDLMTADGSKVITAVDCGVPSTTEDVETVALAILSALAAWDEQRRN